MAGVKVTLLGGGADGKLSTTVDNTSVEAVTDANGNSRYLTDDVEAAQLAVNISDRQQLKPDA